jgi:hypothetical protein
MKVKRGSGGHRPPPRWQVTVRECRECPVQSRPSGSFRAHATSANHHVRVARASRMNGHTAIAGGRCLAAGFMPPPRSRSITRSSVRSLTHHPFVRLPDYRTSKTPGTLPRKTTGREKSVAVSPAAQRCLRKHLPSQAFLLEHTLHHARLHAQHRRAPD